MAHCAAEGGNQSRAEGRGCLQGPGRLGAGGLLPDALAGWVAVVEGLGKPLTAVEPQQQQRAHHCLGQGEGRASL